MSNRLIRGSLLAMVVFALAACSGGGGGGAAPAGGSGGGTAPAPSINSFSAASSTINAGASTTLTAVFSNGTGSINYGVGVVSSGTPVTVSPATTTTYTLTVTNSDGVSVTATTTVTVLNQPTPIVLAIGTPDLPYAATLAKSTNGYYQITGLIPGHRYAFDITTTNWPTITYYSDAFLTAIQCDPNVFTTCSIIPTGNAIWIRISTSWFDPSDITINAQHVSAPSEFEGKWDAPIVLDYASGGNPHVGKVDEYVSYYRIQGLTVGKTYTIWTHSMSEDVRMGTLDPVAHTWVGGNCTPNNTWLNGFWVNENCTWTATDTSLLIGIDNTSLAAGSAYILNVKEAVVSEGSAGAPVTLNYSGGKAAALGRVAKGGTSYYKVTGLSAGTDYVLNVNDVARDISPGFYDPLSLQPYGNDPTYSTAATCITQVNGWDSPKQCSLTASGTELYFKVVGPAQVSGMTYSVSVTPVPVDEGTAYVSVPLTYAALPYTGQVSSWFSEYSVSGLTPNAYYQVFLRDITGIVTLDTWYDTSPVLNCMTGGQGVATCALYSGPNGIINVRPGGIQAASDTAALGSFYTLDIKPAPMLTAVHKDTSGPIAIDDPTAALNPVTPTLVPITVSGDPVTSISNVTVELFIRHGQPAQLTLELIAPDGVTTVLLAETNTLQGAMGIFNLKLNDYSLKRIETGTAPYYATYQPRTPLHVLNGMNANGTWTLRITDDQYANISDQTGEYYAWGISFQ